MQTKILILSIFLLLVIATISVSGIFDEKINDENTSNYTKTLDHGIILAQDLDRNNQGYTIIRLWGSYYEMGYAQVELLGEYIVGAYHELKNLLGDSYDEIKEKVSNFIWIPTEIEDEIEGIADGLSSLYPSENIDVLDIMVGNIVGDLIYEYGCRSHICWGRYISSPVKTLSTRRLDFSSIAPTIHHHVLSVRQPDDGSTRWISLTWPGIVTVTTAINEYGVLTSTHDFHSQETDFSENTMNRGVALRYATTYANNSDVSTHVNDIYYEMQKYEIMLGGFLNYYAPEGYAGVIAYHPYPPSQFETDFYNLRLPQEIWHHGEAMVTTNGWTDGTYTPLDENFGADEYYNDESPKTLENHWDLLDIPGTGVFNLHMMSVEYRGQEDMTIWAEGKINSNKRTPRLEWEWYDLFNGPTVPKINGPDKGEKNNVYNYSISSIDVQGYDIYYILDWDYESEEETIGPFPSGEEQTVTHIWNESGSYVVKVKARNEINAESDWSNPLVVTMPKSKHYNHFNFLFEKLIYRFLMFEKILTQKI